MDFTNLLRSAEQLLYEVVSWLVFYPLTLWRCIIRPIPMIAYAEQELTRPPEDRFAEALSPPIFLFLTLIIAHSIQTSIFHNEAVFEGVRRRPISRAQRLWPQHPQDPGPPPGLACLDHRRHLERSGPPGSPVSGRQLSLIGLFKANY